MRAEEYYGADFMIVYRDFGGPLGGQKQVRGRIQLIGVQDWEGGRGAVEKQSWWQEKPTQDTWPSFITDFQDRSLHARRSFQIRGYLCSGCHVAMECQHDSILRRWWDRKGRPRAGVTCAASLKNRPPDAAAQGASFPFLMLRRDTSTGLGTTACPRCFVRAALRGLDRPALAF